MMARRQRQRRVPFRAVPLLVCGFLLVLLLGNSPAAACVDDDAGLLAMLSERGIQGIGACSDAPAYCTNEFQAGQVARRFCCATCSGASSGASTGGASGNASTGGGSGGFGGNALADFLAQLGNDPSALLPPADKPLDVFFLGGQSECRGAASSSDLSKDGDGYPELQGAVDGVWFAGYRGALNAQAFTIEPMSARSSQFGPEVSFGQRIYEARGGSRNVLVVKYCDGGTNVRDNWNPDSAANSWDEGRDDGTSSFLLPHVSFGDTTNVKAHQYVNAIYTVRRTAEALTAAGIDYTWAGIVWVQGSADYREDINPLWKNFGENTARVWNGFRKHMVGPGGAPVPIIDNGSENINELKSGKEYAISIVDGGTAYSADYGGSANDDTGTCQSGPSSSCVGTQGFYVDGRVFDHFGYDPAWLADPAIAALIGDGAGSAGEFHWFVDFPSNLHSAYEGIILKGWLLANAFLRNFADPASYVLSPYAGSDIEELFPYRRCPDGSKPTEDDLCWIDYRTGVPTLAPVTPLTAAPVAVPQPTRNPTQAPVVGQPPPPPPATTPAQAPVVAPTPATTGNNDREQEPWGVAGPGGTPTTVLTDGEDDEETDNGGGGGGGGGLRPPSSPSAAADSVLRTASGTVRVLAALGAAAPLLLLL